MKALLAIIAAALLAGCSMFNRDSISVDYPADLQAMCVRSSARVQANLAAHGMPTTRRWSVKVRKHIGTNKVRGMWAWYDDVTRQNIGGYHSTGVIVVGCSPNGDEVSEGVMDHEMYHYWLVSNGYSVQGSHAKHKELGLM